MSPKLDYLGVKKCGCAVSWVSAEVSPEHLADSVAQMIRDGLDVQRVTTEEARVRLKICYHDGRNAPSATQEVLALDAPPSGDPT